MKRIGIIGGTGLEQLGLFSESRDVKLETPFGEPSSELQTGKVNGLEVVHLARHGRDHRIASSRVNYRANLYALREMECTHILSTTACGSLRQEINPGEYIVLDQFIDFTRYRPNTICEEFQPDEFRYTPLANPFSDDLRDDLVEAVVLLKLTVHTKGTVITIDGPRFSTRAESNLYKSWGADIVNMTTAPEIILANELGIPIATIALCTDFDSWRTDIGNPTNAEIREIIDNNLNNLREILKTGLSKMEK